MARERGQQGTPRPGGGGRESQRRPGEMDQGGQDRERQDEQRERQRRENEEEEEEES